MQTFNLDISTKNIIPLVNAKQGDVGRKITVTITDDGKPYALAGSVFSVWYSGASGEGNYTNIGDASAFSVVGNSVTVELITQMLVNAGNGELCLMMHTAEGKKIGMWNIPYYVEEVPGAGSQEAKMYYDAFQKAVEDLPYPDETLAIPGKAADAAAVGKALAKLAEAKPILAGTDLDGMIEPGKYGCQTAEVAGTLLGCPVAEPFTLDVRYANGKGPHVGQELRPAGKGARLYRQFVSFPGILSDEGKALYERFENWEKPQEGGYTGEIDLGWYDESGDYILTDAEQLYGFAQMVNDGHTFIGETVRLGADIIVNTSDASDWDNTTNKPAYTWTPIGTHSIDNGLENFRGVFDGQGHYISGLYGGVRNNNGLFGFTYGATIKNVAVVNSYFATNHPKGQFLGSVVARAYNGTLKNLYSDAILESDNSEYYTGGIAGCVRDGIVDSCAFKGFIVSASDSAVGNYIGGIVGGPDGKGHTAKITNCLFVGSISANDNNVGGIVGMLGADGLIDNCVSVGSISHEANNVNVGAIIGEVQQHGKNGHKILNCYYTESYGLDLYGGKSDYYIEVDTTCSSALSAECVKHSMVPTQWMKVYDSENKLTLEDIGAAAIDVLWENAKPSDFFYAQTLQLDLSRYDYVAVIAAESSSYNPTYMPAVVVPCTVGCNGTITGTGFDFTHQQHPQQVWLFNRSFSVLPNGLEFGVGNQCEVFARNDMFQNNDNKAVPMFILGIKGVLK